MNSVIRADGNPQFSMFSMMIGAVLNVILDTITIFICHWGVKGAAAATIVGQIASCVITIIYFGHPKTFRLSRSAFKLRPKLIARFCSLGVSSFITQISIVVVCAVTNNVMVKYGAVSEFGSDIPLSVIGIVMKVFSIVIAIVVGIAVGGQPIAGYNYGSGNYERVLKTFRLEITACAIVGAIATLAFELIPNAIISVFGNEGEILSFKYRQLLFFQFILAL